MLHWIDVIVEVAAMFICRVTSEDKERRFDDEIEEFSLHESEVYDLRLREEYELH